MTTPDSLGPLVVTVLTQSDCRFCAHADTVLARVGRDYPLTVRHIPLDSDEGRALAARHGVLFAPGVLLDGALVSYGRLSERRLRRQLSRHQPEQHPQHARSTPSRAQRDEHDTLHGDRPAEAG
jgi:hypothetical protein